IIELKNQRGEVFYDKLKFIYLELPKFNKLEHELKTQFDKWMYVLTKLEKLHERPRQLQERIFKKLFQAAEIAQFTPQEQQAYEESIKVYRDIQNIVSTAKMEGLEEGRQVGLKEGMQVGMEEGIEVGKKAGLKQRTLEIARKLKDKGTALADIMDLTGLNKEDIDQL
ncbi:MAG: PD-(D/E)XK nuclease family transposase, partial [Bacteroidota bacterium]